MSTDAHELRLLWNRDIRAPRFVVRCACGWESREHEVLAQVPVACAVCGAPLVAR